MNITYTLWQQDAAIVCGLNADTALELLELLRQEFPEAVLWLTCDIAPR